MSIRILPATVANKIAAGEVIERPASVVKELVENSIDAGADHISIELEDGGAALIRVADNGCGMDADDLELAFAGHATSKLENEDDLFRVRTMGFRGEALASVGSVSDVRIVSRTPDSDSAHEVEMRAGEIGPVKACGGPVGTTVEVRRLFYNVPVRKKFLKTTATEMAHISEAVTRLALVNPEIHFELGHNGRSVFNLPQADDPGQRIGDFFGGKVAENMVPVSWIGDEIELHGYLLPPTVDRRNTRMQYTYVNRRFVRDSVLLHAISEAYSKLMISARKPVCFLFISVDPGDVDVNVHPAKLEIKFRHTGQVHQEVLASLREGLRDAKITPQAVLAEGGSPQSEERESVRKAIADFFARSNRAEAGTRPRGSAGGAALGTGPPSARPEWRPPMEGTEAAPAAAHVRGRQPLGGCMQVLDTYIVLEEGDAVTIVDQHALHERLIYNEVRRRVDEGSVDSQQLLVPELVELPKQEFYTVMSLQEELARFGMQIESFGDSTVIVRSYPSVLRHFQAEAFLRDLLDALAEDGGAKALEDRVENVLKVMACRGAVKAGQRLSADQLRWLLERRAADGTTDTCPHGRPTTVTLSRTELDKQFRRLG